MWRSVETSEELHFLPAYLIALSKLRKGVRDLVIKSFGVSLHFLEVFARACTLWSYNAAATGIALVRGSL